MSKREAATSLGTLVDERAGFRWLCVGRMRGSASSRAYVVCPEDERPRDVLMRALGRDRTDLGVMRQPGPIERQVEQIAGRRQLERGPERLLGLQRETRLERSLEVVL